MSNVHRKSIRISIVLPDHIVTWPWFPGIGGNDSHKIVNLSEISAHKDTIHVPRERIRSRLVWKYVFVHEMFLIQEMKLGPIGKHLHLLHVLLVLDDVFIRELVQPRGRGLAF